MSFRYKPEKLDPEYSPRIQQIADEYERIGFEGWHPNETDVETVKEFGYLKFKKKRPDTAKQEVLSFHRLKDQYGTGKEFMIYKVRYSVMDNKDREFVAEVWMGKRPRFSTTDLKNEDDVVIDKRITKWNMVYTTEWDPKEFEKILKEYSTSRMGLYLASTTDDYWQNWSGRNIMIRDRDMFKAKSYEELLAYDANMEDENRRKEITKKPLTR